MGGGLKIPSWGAGETNFYPTVALGKGLPYALDTPYNVRKIFLPPILARSSAVTEDGAALNRKKTTG